MNGAINVHRYDEISVVDRLHINSQWNTSHTATLLIDILTDFSVHDHITLTHWLRLPLWVRCGCPCQTPNSYTSCRMRTSPYNKSMIVLLSFTRWQHVYFMLEARQAALLVRWSGALCGSMRDVYTRLLHLAVNVLRGYIMPYGQ